MTEEKTSITNSKEEVTKSNKLFIGKSDIGWHCGDYVRLSNCKGESEYIVQNGIWYEIFPDTAKEITDSEIMETVSELADMVAKLVSSTVEFTLGIMRDFPNKRVLHLIMYHPKERVRKKNIKRLKAWSLTEYIRQKGNIYDLF